MNDFDFEELDKAVSSLAAKTDEEQGGVSSSPAPTEPPKSVLPSRPQPKPEPPKLTPPEPKEMIEPRPTPQPLRSTLTRTRRPPFMDIMPPVSRKTNTRVSPTLQPISASKETRPEVPDPAKETPKRQPEITPADIHKAEPAPVVTEQPDEPKLEIGELAEKKDDVRWPDPLDFHADSLLEDEDENEVAEKPEDKPAITSPFLAEAKVEKRPLGAFSSFKAAEEPPKPRGEGTEEFVDSEPIVDELTPGRDGLFEEPEAPEPEGPTEKTSSEPSAGPEEKAKPEASEKKEAPPKPDMHGAAMMSIPQQYRTENKPTDKATRSIFDTKEYHPPLLEAAVHDHQGSSMWTKLFIAFVVLVLLGVAAYFVYLFVFAAK